MCPIHASAGVRGLSECPYSESDESFPRWSKFETPTIHCTANSFRVIMKIG